MNLLGNAETGVSIMLLLLLLVELCDTGCGRANGLGGPEAPALRSADAEGEGGGRTTLVVCSFPGPFLRGATFVEERGEELESAVLLPPSEGSSGIWTFNTGLLPPPPPNGAELVRDGGVKPSCMEDVEDMETWRFLWCVCERGGGEGGLVPFLATAPTSTDWERSLDVALSLLGFSAFTADEAQCCERIDRLSSMGVNMLRDLTDIRLTGSNSCWDAGAS
jgi:hypothetical protein